MAAVADEEWSADPGFSNGQGEYGFPQKNALIGHRGPSPVAPRYMPANDQNMGSQ